ncbi:MAG: hypothetical protein ABSD57_08575 [Verrucomicrobiota bacterium]|jgi:hypothetical protein
MTTKTRNWVITLLILAAPFLFFLGLLFFWTAEPLPPIAPLPNSNGYNDLVKAGAMADDNTGDYYEMKLEELRRLVAKNSDVLQTARNSLQEDCAVPLQFSLNYVSRHLPELADYKRLAQAFVAEGRLAEMENRPGDAVKSYLDAIRLGHKSAHGGILIDQLVGTAIEAMGVSHLQKLGDQLDAKTCHETAATLETLDAQRQTWNEVMQQESAWSRRAYPGIKYRLGELVMSSSLKKALQGGERKFNKQQLIARQLLIDLAARAYELDKGHAPTSVADLVPDYLKAVPQDPVTGTNLVYSPR